MSDWHSLIYCKPLFGFDDAIKKWNNNPIKMNWEDGHFSSLKQNVEDITSLHPKIVFAGLVHEYSNGVDTFWNIIFSKEKGIIYEGKQYEQDLGCFPYEIEVDDIRIRGFRELKDDERSINPGEMFYP